MQALANSRVNGSTYSVVLRICFLVTSRDLYPFVTCAHADYIMKPKAAA
jgi:hypothetical protein